jgi:phage gpG-like protein
MITGYVFGADAVLKRLAWLGPQVSLHLARFVRQKAIKLQRYVKQDKLTGQVLHVRTGTLRRSITYSITDNQRGIFATVGTNIKYAPPHEYGFQGAETVRAHLRMMVQAWGRPVNNPRQIQINAFTRQVNLPERSFLRSALNEMQNEIRSGLEAEIRAALKGTV